MDLNGINQEVLDHNSFSQGLEDHNTAIREHNSNVMAAYNTAESTRKDSRDVDDILHGVTGPLQSGFALYNNAKQFKDMSGYGGGGLSGVASYISDTTKARTNNIYDTIKGVTADKPVNPNVSAPSDVDPAEADKLARLNTLGAGTDSQQIWGEADQGTKDFITKNQPKGGVGSANAVVDDEPEVSKSALPTSLEDATSRIAGAFGVGEKGASAIGNVAGKLTGIGAGAVSVIDQVEGKDQTGLEKASGVMSDIGAGLDIVGTVVPFLEPLGALATATAGVLGGIDDVEGNIRQQKTNKANLSSGTQKFQVQQSTTGVAVGGASQQKAEAPSSTASF